MTCSMCGHPASALIDGRCLFCTGQITAELDSEREKVRVLREALQVIQADATLTIGEPVPMGRLAAKLVCCESTARQALTATEPKDKP